MLIRIKDSRPGCSFYPGQLVRVGDRQAEEWIEQGLATEATDLWVPLKDDPRPSTDPVPPMKPARNIDRKGNVIMGLDLGTISASVGLNMSIGVITRLNLGCGTDVKPGFINLDIRPLDGIVRCDVSDSEQMSAYQGATEILAYDILEHFPRAKARQVLALWVSLLAPDGRIEIRCPDLRHAMKVAPNDEWLEQLLYGGQDYPENQHLCGFTTGTLCPFIANLGMEITLVRQTTAGNLEIEARKSGEGD